ncbi:MAG: hypothetical protein ACT4NL_14045 [Pseudomarimonas sp.]
MNTPLLDREARLQGLALLPASSDEPASVETYRQIYAGIRWAPMPALASDFTARVLARVGIVEEELSPVERRLVPMLFTTFGIGGGLTAGPQVLGALGQVAFDFTGLPWLQAAAALTAIATAAVIDRTLGRRKRAKSL